MGGGNIKGQNAFLIIALGLVEMTTKGERGVLVEGDGYPSLLEWS
jgi:hypothetical protein